MNLKLIINRARMNGVTVYCIMLLLVYIVVKFFTRSGHKAANVPLHLHKFLKFKEGYVAVNEKMCLKEINALSSTVEVLNYEREVFNMNRFGRVSADTTVLAVQVHRDAERLQYLIVSFAQVQHIETALVIFSHSFFDEKINKLITSITFCRFMQIFYPYSLQLYPNKFPGLDPEDCISSRTSDAFCSNRDARRTEHKHHWWWKAYFIFTHLDWSAKYTGTVIFLEEDSYVLPDLLYMLRFAKRSLTSIPGVSVMVFGRPYSRDLNYDLLIVDTWRPPFDKGLAFNKTVWKKITTLSSFFCTYDDLSWSYSLLNLFFNLHSEHIDMVATMAPRVFTTRLYPNGRDAYQSIYWQVKDAPLFPSSVKAALVYSNTGRLDSEIVPPPKGNGGWSDIRDHLLCLDPFSSTEQTDAMTEHTTTTPLFTVLPHFNYSARVILMEDTPKL